MHNGLVVTFVGPFGSGWVCSLVVAAWDREHGRWSKDKKLLTSYSIGDSKSAV